MTYRRTLVVAGSLALVLASPAGDAVAQTVDTTTAAFYEQNGKQLFAAERWLEAAGQFASAYTYGNDPSMLFNMALCYRRAGNGKRALALYQRYLVEVPTSPQREAVLARIEQLRQELASSQGEPSSGKSAEAHQEDAKKFYEAERWTDSADEFEAAYASSKDSALLYNLALCYRRAGNARRALDSYQRYLAEAQDASRRASIEARIAELEQALKTDPAPTLIKDAAAHEREGKRRFEAGRWADAAAEFESAHALGRDPGMLFNLAFSYRRAGSANRALSLYQRYLAEAPDTPKRAVVETRIKELQKELAANGAGVAASAVASGQGCTKDSECKGTRVCEQGRCVEETLKPSGPVGAGGCDPPCGTGLTCTPAGACVAGQGATSAGAAADESVGPKSYAIGVGVGYASGGSVTIDHSDVSPDGGMLLDIYLDEVLAPSFSLGGYVTLSSMGYSGADVSYKSFGGVIKARLSLAKNVRLRPGLTLGYNRISSSVFGDTVTGMNIGMHVDVAFATSSHFAVVPRLGFFTQPSGGNKNMDVTFGAHFYLALGIEFGR